MVAQDLSKNFTDVFFWDQNERGQNQSAFSRTGINNSKVAPSMWHLPVYCLSLPAVLWLLDLKFAEALTMCDFTTALSHQSNFCLSNLLCSQTVSWGSAGTHSIDQPHVQCFEHKVEMGRPWQVHRETMWHRCSIRQKGINLTQNKIKFCKPS